MIKIEKYKPQTYEDVYKITTTEAPHKRIKHKESGKIHSEYIVQGLPKEEDYEEV